MCLQGWTLTLFNQTQTATVNQKPSLLGDISALFHSVTIMFFSLIICSLERIEENRCCKSETDVIIYQLHFTSHCTEPSAKWNESLQFKGKCKWIFCALEACQTVSWLVRVSSEWKMLNICLDFHSKADDFICNPFTLSFPDFFGIDTLFQRSVVPHKMLAVSMWY